MDGCTNIQDKPYTVFVNIGPGLLATYTGRYFKSIEEAQADIIATEQRGPEKIVAKIEDIRTRTAVLIRGGKQWHLPKSK